MKKTTLFLLIIFTSLISSAQVKEAVPKQQSANPAPFVIPALREWKGGTGTFILKTRTSLVVDPKYAATLTPIANTFLSDLKTLTGKSTFTVRKGAPKSGDIFFTLNSGDADLGKEGYTLTIKKSITIDANEPLGAFWATRSLLQILEQDKYHQKIPAGIAKDFPQFEVRGFVLDCGRKFFSMEFLRNYVKFMSYYKMNDFQIHLNDNGFKEFFNDNWDSTYSAFRLENHTYPELTAKDGSYSKKEFIELQKLAAQYGVNIIPEIDVPAHSLALTKAIPAIGSNKYGRDHLDLNNPLTYEVIDNVFREYLKGPNPVFTGAVVGIGTDEYAKEESEKFRAFTDHYISFVQSFGKKVRLWGSLTHAKGTTPVKVDNVMMNLWSKDYSDPTEMMKLGYDCISTPDGWIYIVPAAGYYYDYLDTKNLYHNWTPAVNVGKQIFAENNPQIRGGSFCVWNDHVGNGITEKDVHHRVFPAMQTLSQKMWGGSDTAMSYEAFVEHSKAIGEGPGLNMLGKIKGKDSLVLHYNNALQFKGGKTLIQTPYKGIGYGYTVSFSIKPDRNNGNNAVLFSSPDAVVKLKQQATGKLGFSREHYHYNFNYAVPAEKWTHIVITGDNKGTSLYVNGVLTEKLEGNRNVFANGKSIAKVQTLFFPLQFIGDKANAFNGLLKNIKVFNCILPADKISALAKEM
ncbi:MAG: family 20 glycosylhydrolase [Flavisolibacter sp.]